MPSKEERRKDWFTREAERLEIKRRENAEYDRRKENLLTLGFDSYDEYLASDVWKKIRGEVLRSSLCSICKKPNPSQIHHLDYSVDTLIGLDRSRLVPICGYCHKNVEFSHRNKRSFDAAARRYAILLRRSAGIEQRRLRGERAKRRSKKRK